MNRDFLKNAESMLLELLAISGVSGDEQKIMQAIVRRLRQAGATAETLRMDRPPRSSPKKGNAGNLVLRLPGTLPGKRRLLSAHVDTVPLCRDARPVRRGRYIVPADKNTALGADDRAGAAVLLAVASEILQSRLPHPPLTFLWTVQEEVGLYGARYAKLSMLGKPQMAFNFDGGASNKVTIGATGGYRMQIHIEGVASHAGVVPEKGVNAITIAALAIARLHRDGWLGLIEKKGRRGTSNVGVIYGGDATNVVTPEVVLRAEVRSHDPVFRNKIIREVQRTFEKAAKNVRNVEGIHGGVRFDGSLDYESFRLREDEPCVETACAAVRRYGREPMLAVSNGGLDANWLSTRGIPTVSFGCGQENAHTASERLDRVEFREACKIAMCLATGLKSEHQ